MNTPKAHCIRNVRTICPDYDYLHLFNNDRSTDSSITQVYLTSTDETEKRYYDVTFNI